MKKKGFTDYVYDFVVDYNYIDTDAMKNIYNYLMKKTGIAWIHNR